MNNKLNFFDNKAVGMVVSFLLLVSFAFVIKGIRDYNPTAGPVIEDSQSDEKRPCVVIDAGHGGIDPGKVGINGALEKDINLAIAQKLKDYLENLDVKVVMTRNDDNGLYNENDKNKKVKDMKERLNIIEENKPSLAVSIHQNSYPDEQVKGIQVFYYKDSVKGEKAAKIMQDQLIESLNPEKRREAKDNCTYYLLKKTSIPLIIVECGFLSNRSEADMLNDEIYQQKVAEAIGQGILKYLNCI